METSDFLARSHHAHFVSTCWTTIQIGAGHDEGAALARQELCRDYWYPLYAHIKRLGHQSQDAADLTQGFFADILSRPWFDRADQTKGRFRSFLLASLDHFLRDQHVRKKALKRGGGFQHIPFDPGSEEACSAVDQTGGLGPGEIYEVEWVSTIVALSLRRLEAEYTTDGKAGQYAHLKTFLAAEGDQERYDTIAEALQTTSANVKTRVHRLRKRYGNILRQEVERTVAEPADVESEVRHMRVILSTIGV